MSNPTKLATPRVAIIGTGFGGLGMAYYLKQAGITSFTIFEKAADVGGVWRENTYPGAGCDVPSHLYSFSFEPHYPWACRYGKQHEIVAYMQHCVQKHDLRAHMRFGCEVTGAEFDALRGLWQIQLASGERHEAEVLISAVGQLHHAAYPKIPGREKFQGKMFHSAHWDHSYDLNGKTVAVIGTGASAVQFVPEIVKQVKQLKLFQRSPGWVGPKFERTFNRFERWLLNTFPIFHDLDRLRIFFICEGLAYAYNGHAWAEKIIRSLSKLQIRIQVRDPVLRKKLTPDFAIGCKRILLTTEWLRALVKPNVEVVDDAVAEITATGVRTADGQLREVDAIIYGTGFAATDFLAPMQVRGLDGRDLRETWKQGAEAYLGMSVSGFPNFFVLYGPNTNVGSGSIIYMLERQQRYITQMIQAQQQQAWHYANLKADAEAEYNREIRQRSDESTYAGTCQSWYKTADGRNTNNWIGSMLEFRRRTLTPQLERYEIVPRAVQATLSQAA